MMPPVPFDKRRHPRHLLPPDAPQVQMRLDSGIGKPMATRAVQIRDLSRHGMAFHHFEAVAKGTRCIGIVHQQQTLTRVVGKVVHCRSAGDGFVVGVRFTHLARLPARQPGVALADEALLDQMAVDI